MKMMMRIKVTSTKERGTSCGREKHKFIGGGYFQAPLGLMSLLCWNCQGLRNSETDQELGDLIQAQDPSVVFLVETWLTKVRLEEIRARYKFGGMIEVSKEGRGGGVLIFWKKGCDISVGNYSPNHIDAIVNKGK